MKKIFPAALVFLSAIPAMSYAEDPPAAPAEPLSFNVGLFTDYRFRGISQTRLKPAVQGGADYAFSSGFYVGTWLSNINWIRDAGRFYNDNRAPTDPAINVGSAPIEWDIYGGYKGEIVKDLAYDVGVLQYYYPLSHYGNIPGAKTANTTEVYGALTYNIVTVKYSHALTTLFGFADSRNSGYLEGVAAFDLGNGWGVAPHIGYQRVAKNGDYSYTDYSVTGTKDLGSGLVASLAVVGTSTKTVDANPGSYAYYSPSGKNLGKTFVVLGIKKTF